MKRILVLFIQMHLLRRGNLIGIPRSVWKDPEFTFSDDLEFETKENTLTVILTIRKPVKKLYSFDFEGEIISIDYSYFQFPHLIFSLTLAEGSKRVVFISTDTGKKVFITGEIFWPLKNGKLLINTDNKIHVFDSQGNCDLNLSHPKVGKIMKDENYVLIPYFALAVLVDVPTEFPDRLILDPLKLPKLLSRIQGPYPEGRLTLHFADGIKIVSLKKLLKCGSVFINQQLDSDPENVYLPSFELKMLKDKITMIKMADYIDSEKLPWLIIAYYISRLFDLPSYEVSFFPLALDS